MQVNSSMERVNCLKTLEEVIYILSKNGILFIKDITNADVLKITLHLIAAITTETFVALNIRNAIKLHDMKLANWMVCVLFPMVHCTIKGITLLLNKKCLLSVLEDLKSDIFNKHSEKLNRHVQLIHKISKLVLRYFALAAVVVVIVFCFLPFFTNMMMMVPPPFEMGRFQIPYKIIHLFLISYFGTNTACCDVFFMTLIGIVVAQLNILREQLIYLLKDAKEMQRSRKRTLETVTNAILMECVTLHKEIIRFTCKLNKLLALPLFAQYVSGCFVICNTILQMTVMGNTDAAIIIGLCGYTCITFAQMAIYHWLANEVIFESNKIIESCYTSNWYELSLRHQKSLILLMERSHRPLTIQLYSIVNISLESLGVIIRWSYSIFAVIKARYK